MRITITRSEIEFYNAVAWRIIAQILKKPDSLIGLATGRTIEGVYAVMREIYHQHPFDTSRVTVFGLDEITNLPREYPGSCYFRILNQVVQPLGIAEQNFLMPPSLSDDFEADARRYEEQIAARGKVDLQILGIGENGHIGFNQPGTPFESRAWHSKMDSALEARVRRESQTPDNVYLGGLTLGIQNIMHSRKIILAANGAHKAKIIAAALKGPVTTVVPASVLQLHPDCEAILDPAAAAKLIETIPRDLWQA
jgi:glucosamine-6-phosphate deaminase